MATAGYSGTPLARKLGIAAGHRVVLEGAPSHYASLVDPLPADVTWPATADATTDLVHVFVTEKAVLASALARLRRTLKPDAIVWVSWPKKAAKVATDVTEDTVREVALPLGFVDVKVCAVDATWSGLKLVVRKALR